MKFLLDTCVISELTKKGRPVPVLDGLLAAKAKTFGLTFVTRNVAHVEATGVSLLNPWRL